MFERNKFRFNLFGLCFRTQLSIFCHLGIFPQTFSPKMTQLAQIRHFEIPLSQRASISYGEGSNAVPWNNYFKTSFESSNKLLKSGNLNFLIQNMIKGTHLIEYYHARDFRPFFWKVAYRRTKFDESSVDVYEQFPKKPRCLVLQHQSLSGCWNSRSNSDVYSHSFRCRRCTAIFLKKGDILNPDLRSWELKLFKVSNT